MTAIAPSIRRPIWPLALLAVLLMMIMVSTVMLGIALLYRPLYTVYIVDTDLKFSLETRGDTVAAALEEAGISLNAGDAIYPSLTTNLSPDLEIIIERSRRVTLRVDGQAQSLITRINAPLTFLASAGIPFNPSQDRIYLDDVLIEDTQLHDWSTPFDTLEIHHAIPFRLFEGDVGEELTSFAATVGEALLENKIPIYQHDRLEPPSDTPLSPLMNVHIDRAKAIHIYSGNQSQRAYVTASDIATALEEAGWVLGPLDYPRQPLDTPVTEGMRIDVTRVHEETTEHREVIPFQTVWIADSELELDQRRHVSGQSGERLLRFQVRYEDGNEISREQISAQTTREPQNETYYYGTRIVLRTIETEFGPQQYWRVIRMEITSYKPSDGPANITATGLEITKGIVATHPDVIPYHTRVYVPGYGIGQVEDTGYGLTTTRRWLDLGYEDENYVPWRKQENVYLLTPIPEDFPYVLPP